MEDEKKRFITKLAKVYGLPNDEDPCSYFTNLMVIMANNPIETTSDKQRENLIHNLVLLDKFELLDESFYKDVELNKSVLFYM